MDEAAAMLPPEQIPPEDDGSFRRRILMAMQTDHFWRRDAVLQATGGALDMIARRFGLERKQRGNHG